MKKGHKLSAETRQKMRVAQLGKIGYWKGKKRPLMTEEQKKKISASKKGTNTGKNSYSYKHGKYGTKEYVNIYSRMARARRRGAVGSFSLSEWELLKKQYGFVCPCCKKSEPAIKLTADHIIPLAKGGSNFIENIQPLCGLCNSKKSTKIVPKYELVENLMQTV